MASQVTPAGDDLIQNILSEEAGQSSFACTHCRRQKIKCDRMLKACGNCTKVSRPCEYPRFVQKPGPKAGTHRRPRAPPSQTVAGDTDHALGTAKRLKTDGSGPNSAIFPVLTVSSSSPNFALVQANSQRPSVITTSTNSQSSRNASKLKNPFLKLVHPDHEPTDSARTAPIQQASHRAFPTRFHEACRSIDCTGAQGWELIKVFFGNMTGFSLFHRPTFEQKLAEIAPLAHLTAFLSAIFSYALRFRESSNLELGSTPDAQIMLEKSFRLQYECVEGCEDEDPPLHLLQSFFLVTFQKLIQGVRGKTWRMLGDCIRMGYELHLHLVDGHLRNSQSDVDLESDSESWVLAEERRRMWWALWELDVFTSTIRKLPNAIDERLNFTLLPVSDDHWFQGKETRSCFLVSDAMQRWRNVVQSGNQSPQTWFVLINSYMYDAFQMGAFPEVWRKRIGFDSSVVTTGEEQLVPRIRDFIEDCAQAAHAHLPTYLSWDARYLAFKASVPPDRASPRNIDCMRYCIHVIGQLGKVMLCTWDVNDIPLSSRRPIPEKEGSCAWSKSDLRTDRRTWGQYIDAANLTAQVLRNSAPHHYQFVNPLIANALWWAAASLVVAKLFGPPEFDSRAAQSNFDLLVTTLNKFEAFWQIPSVLKYKLRNLEETLKHLQRRSAPSPQAQNEMPSDTKATLTDTMATSQLTKPQQQVTQTSTPNGLGTTDDIFNALEGQDWTPEALFDFSAIPSFGFGEADFLQATPFDTTFEGNPLIQQDGLNFNELFSYPYQ